MSLIKKQIFANKHHIVTLDFEEHKEHNESLDLHVGHHSWNIQKEDAILLATEIINHYLNNQ